LFHIYLMNLTYLISIERYWFAFDIEKFHFTFLHSFHRYRYIAHEKQRAYKCSK
jgi:hypothetical protein